MLITCKCCGARASLDLLVDDEEASAALTAALGFSPIGGLLIKYLGLFRPKEKKLSWSRVASLLGELLPMVERQQIERNGASYSAPLPVWADALGKVIEARNGGFLQLPLKTHGYLLEVIATDSKRYAATQAVLPAVDGNAAPVTLTAKQSGTAKTINLLDERMRRAAMLEQGLLENLP